MPPKNKSNKLPGFNLPFDYIHDNHFQSALDITKDYEMPLTTIREFTMLRLMNQLTDKPDWDRKVLNNEIANKWKKEALETPGLDITQEMVDWCIDELRYKARIYEKTGMVTVYNGDVVKSDVAVPEDLRVALNDAVKPLEDVPLSQLDWHPGSDEKVLDLVHPSLFPLVYGLTRILPKDTTTLEDCISRTAEGDTLQLYEDKKYAGPQENTTNPSHNWKMTRQSFSRKFQWLPCDVDVSGNVPKIKSYINNLHPQQHAELYSIIEKIIGHAIPLWNESLTRQKTPAYHFTRVEYHEAVREKEADEPEQKEDEDDDDYDERLREWEEEYNNIPAAQPSIKPFQPPSGKLFEKDGITLKSKFKVNLTKEYGKRGIQVIVKLANIHLTPEKPEYNGGTWHVEGQLNEHICASALYYYSSDNITPSRLSFRQLVNDGVEEIDYSQGYNRWIKDIFGCEADGPAMQEIGSVATCQGRLITFPNMLQHQVQPFRLADPTRPGHRKILALFLVDPNVKVISTANVPCQRLDWWREKVNESTTRLGKLPVEVKDNVYGHTDFPVQMKKAKELRLELMDERKQFVISHDQLFQEATFSLCEH